MFKTIYKSIFQSRGFTLVETLVAISILSISIAAVFSAVQNGIRSSTIAKDQVTAFYLVQEAMEFIRNIRDENDLYTISGDPKNWLAGLSSNSNDPCWYGDSLVPQKTCKIDSYMKDVTTCSNGICPPIKQDSVTGLYGYTNGPDTSFIRKIQFQKISDIPNKQYDQVLVIISISWVARGITKSFQIKELLFDHQ